MAAERKHVRLLPELVPDIILPDQTLRHIQSHHNKRQNENVFSNNYIIISHLMSECHRYMEIRRYYWLKLSTFLVCFCHNYTIYRTNNIKLSYFYKILQTNKLSPSNFSVSYSSTYHNEELYLILFLFWKFSGPFNIEIPEHLWNI